MAVVQIVVKTVKFDIYFSCPPYKELPKFHVSVTWKAIKLEHSVVEPVT